MGAAVCTPVCGAQVSKQVMNIFVSGSWILLYFLEIDSNFVQATQRWLHELDVLC